MKICKLLISALAVFSLCVFTGCDDEKDDNSSTSSPGTVSVSPGTLSFDIDGGVKTVSVTCTGEWIVTRKPAWTDISIATGEGDFDVYVSAEGNYTEDGEPGSARSGIITFSNAEGTSEASVSVGQDGEVNATYISISETNLNFNAEGGSATIVLTAYGSWSVTTSSDWIVVSPSAATGTQSVSVSAPANPNAPRACEVVFYGGDDVSATLTVSQDGDDYSAAPEYSIAAVYGLIDGESLSLSNVYVVGASTEGYVVTDGSSGQYLYVSESDIPAVGDQISVLGRKFDSYGLATVVARSHEVISSNNSVSYPAGDELTRDTIDDYSSSTCKYLTATGKLTGSSLSAGISCTRSVSAVDTPESIGLERHEGEKVALRGFYVGMDGNVIRVLATSVITSGSLILFSDTLEWIAPYAQATGAGDNVATGISTTSAPAVTSASGFMDEFASRGYEFVNSNGTLAAYLQTNYLKMGYTNGPYHTGIVLPEINVSEGEDIELVFDWCPMRGGGLYYDRVAVEILSGPNWIARIYHSLTNPDGATNNGDSPLTWIRESVVIKDYSPSDRIVIRSYPWDEEDDSSYPVIGGSADFDYLRYFIDNIEVDEAY